MEPGTVLGIFPINNNLSPSCCVLIGYYLILIAGKVHPKPSVSPLVFNLSASSVFAYACTSYRRRQWHPTPVLLPGKSHGWRSLVGCSPWGREESDTTERLNFHFSLLCIGEGNGNPLQCSCLENPRDGEPGGLPSTGSHRVGHD